MERYRIVEGVGLYFVTFTIVEWLPVFISEAACKVVIESFNFCVQNKFLRVNSYVIMPTHLHAILFDKDFDAGRLKLTLDDFRKFTGRESADHCVLHMPECFTETLRKYAGEDRQRRFWQPTQHLKELRQRSFGSRRWIICTGTHANRAWSVHLRIGGFPPQAFGWQER